MITMIIIVPMLLRFLIAKWTFSILGGVVGRTLNFVGEVFKAIFYVTIPAVLAAFIVGLGSGMVLAAAAADDSAGTAVLLGLFVFFLVMAMRTWQWTTRRRRLAAATRPTAATLISPQGRGTLYLAGARTDSQEGLGIDFFNRSSFNLEQSTSGRSVHLEQIKSAQAKASGPDAGPEAAASANLFLENEASSSRKSADINQGISLADILEDIKGDENDPEVMRQRAILIGRYLSREVFGEGFYKLDSIPENKLANARDSMSIPAADIILALMDDTAFGSAAEGIVLSSGGVYWKELFQSPNHISWNAAKSLYDVGKVRFKKSKIEFSDKLTLPLSMSQFRKDDALSAIKGILEII